MKICQCANTHSKEQRQLDMAKLEGFIGFYSQVTPNGERKSLKIFW